MNRSQVRQTGASRTNSRAKLRGLTLAVLVAASLFAGVPINTAAAGNTAGNDGFVYVDNSDGELKSVTRNGTVVTYGVTDAKTIGPRTDIDGDGNREVPYVTSNGVIKITDDGGETQQLGDYTNVSPRTPSKLAIGDWDEDGNFDVFFASGESGENIYRIDWDERNSAPENLALFSADAAQFMLGSTDITGDGIRDLVFVTSSSSLYYVNGTGNSKKLTGSTKWGANNNIGLGEPEDLSNSGGSNPSASDYNYPMIGGGSEVEVLANDPGLNVTTIISSGAAKAPPTGADWTGDGVPDHIYINSNGNVNYTQHPDVGTEAGFATDSQGSKIDADTIVGLASRITSFEERESITASGANADVPDLTAANTTDADDDGQVDNVTVTFSKNVNDTTVDAADFSLSTGSVDGVRHPAGIDDDTATLAVSGLPTDDTAATPNVTLAANSVDDTSGNAGPASDTTVTASDAAAPTFRSVTTADRDADGRVDNLTVRFTEAVASGSVEDADVAVGTANGLSGSLGASSGDDGDDLVTFGVTEGSSADTDATPTLSYVQSGGSNAAIQDGTGNLMADTTSDPAIDGAEPVLVSGAYRDADGDATVDRTDLTFSEPVGYGSFDSADWSVTANDVAGLSVDGIAAVSGSTVTLTAAADAGQTGVGTGTEPAIAYDPAGSGAVVDGGGTEAVPNGGGPRSLADGADPVVIDAATTANGLDEVALTVSEGVWNESGQTGALAPSDVAFSDSSGGGVSVNAVTHTAGDATATLSLTGDAETGADTVSAVSGEVYDAGANTAASDATTVRDGTRPSVGNVAGPADGTYGIGETATFTVGYDEAVTVNTTGGTPTVDLTVAGTTRSASYVSGSGTETLAFEYAVQSSDGVGSVDFNSTVIQRNGGTLTDGAGNDAALDFTGSAPSLSGVDADGDRPADPSDATAGPISADNESTYAVDVTFPAAPESGTVTVELTDESGTAVVGTAAADTDSDTTTVSGIDTSALADGAVTVRANHTDDAGNENPTGLVDLGTVTKDTASPTVETLSANTSGQDVEVTVETDESLSGLDVAIDGAETASLSLRNFTESVAGGTYTYDATYSSSTDGDYTVTLETAADGVGNDGSSGENTTVTVDTSDSDTSGTGGTTDTTAPTVSDYAVTNPGGTTVAVAFETDERLGSASVDVSGPETATLSLGAFEESAVAGGYAYEATYEATAAGDYTVELAEATDTAGNAATVGQSATVTIETATVTVDPTATSYLLDTGSEVTLAANADATGPEPTYEWDFDGDGVADASGERVTTSFETPGEHEVRLTAASGDTQTTDRLTVTVENQSATANESEAAIGVDRRSLNFGNVTLGETVTLNLTVTNRASSEQDLTVRQTPIVGEHPGAFAVVDGDAPFSLAPGETRRIEVAFTPQSAGVKEGQLQLISDAGNEPQITVWLSNERTYIVVQQVDEQRVQNPTVNVDAHNVDAADGLDVNVSQPAARAQPVAFDRLGMRVEGASSFAINISYADGPPSPGAATYTPESGRETVQYVRLNHSIDAAAAYEDTVVTYRVDRSALPDGTDPEAVEFHRWNGDEWNFSATGTLVGQSETHYVYRVETPGFSQFVITGPTEATQTGSTDGDGDAAAASADGSTPEPSTEAGAAAESGQTPSPEPARQVGTTAGGDADAGGVLGYLLPLIGLAAAVLFLLFLVLWRRRDDDEEEPENGRATAESPPDW